jgi:hypothetical protein
MNSEQEHTGNDSHRLTPGPVPVSPGSEIATILESGESPVPGTQSEKSQESSVKIASAKELTRILRAAGLSKAAARAVVSNGWKGLQALGSPQPPEDEISAVLDAMKALMAKLEDDKND